MFQISTRVDGVQRTVDLHNLYLSTENTFCHKLDRETLYRALDVVAAIRSHGKLPPLSDEERELRRLESEAYRWECDQRREQRRINQRIKQEQLEAEQEAIAREQAQIEQAEANRRARLERQQRDLELRREQQLVGLEIRAKQQEVWANSVEAAARNAVAVRNQQALLVDVERFLTPPAPPPEPEPPPEPQPEYPENPKIGDPDFYAKWKARRPLRSWW